MKILFPYMARWNSANMSRYYHLFKRVADAGHTVIVVQPPPRNSEETNFIDLPLAANPNIILYTLKINQRIWNFRFPVEKFVKKALYTIGSYFLVRRLVREHSPDVLVVYNLPQYIYSIGVHIPIVFDFADDYLAMMQHELGVSQNHVVSRIGSSVLNKLCQRATLVFCVSQILTEPVKSKRVVLLPNGADPDGRDADGRTRDIRTRPTVIGYVGAFEYFIDLEMMLQVAERLQDCSFLLVGAGRELAMVRDEVSKRKLRNVTLTGAVPHSRAMQLISEMDICLNLFVKGSVADAASPIKLFEYICKGKPVITTRLKETMRIDNGYDVLYYADSLDEVLCAVGSILGNTDERVEKVRRGIEMVRQRYTWDILARTFIEEIAKEIGSSDSSHDQVRALKSQNPGSIQ